MLRRLSGGRRPGTDSAVAKCLLQNDTLCAADECADGRVMDVACLTHTVSLFFLTETYAMINSCDESIACWSDNGETFVVKDPTKFESTIIPQFFKHSKFSSFVRVSW